MLELVGAAQGDRGAGVLVPDRAPNLREESRVRCVASDDLDGDGGAVGLLGGEARLTPHVGFLKLETGNLDADARERFIDLGQRGRCGGSPDHQVEHGRDAPSEREAADDVVGKPRDRDDCREGREREQSEYQPARRPQQIRTGDEQHGRGNRKHDERIFGGRSVADQARRLARRGSIDQVPQSDCNRAGEHARAQQQCNEPEPARKQQCEEQHEHRARGAVPICELGPRLDPLRDVVEEVEHPHLHRTQVVGRNRSEQHDECRDRDAHDVARPAPSRARRDDAEHRRCPVLRRDAPQPGGRRPVVGLHGVILPDSRGSDAHGRERRHVQRRVRYDRCDDTARIQP